MPKINIMVVEDEIITATFINKVLMSLGYSVCAIVTSAKEAIKAAYRDNPDLVLMDIMLDGDEDGIQAAGLLKSELDIPVIFITSYSDDNSIERAKLIEPFGYILKPIKERELHAAITMALFKKDMERKLKESEQKFKKLVQFSRDIIAVLDAEGKVKYCSESVKNVLGYRPAEIIGTNVFNRIHEEDCNPVWDNFLLIINNAGHSEIPEFRFKHKNGSWIYLEVMTNNLLEDELINGIVINAHDITEKTKISRELKENFVQLENKQELLETKTNELEKTISLLHVSENQLRELNTSKDKMMSIIAHDLRSPFNALLGFSDLLLEEFSQLDPETLHSYLSHINSSAKNIYDLMETLLQWAKLQGGKIELHPQPINLFMIVEKVTEVMSIALAKKEILLTNTIDHFLEIYSDPIMISSIFQNLLSNAIKFTKRCGYIKLSAESDEGFAIVSVEDTGVGLKNEQINLILDDLYNVSTNGTAEERGSGLGLRLCKEQIEKQGGKISIVSEIGRGTNITFTLPLLKRINEFAS
ncbi:MAG: ATP-binding protein [bacterium]